MTDTTCQTCGHPEADHSRVAGCTTKVGRGWCHCHGYTAPEPPPSTGTVIPSRASDPATSAKAEPPPVRAGTQRAKMLAGFAALSGDPDDPAHAALVGGMSETAAEAAGVSLSSEYAKRTSELAQAGLVENTGLTDVGAAGHERIVWRITDKGRDVLAGLGQPVPPKPEKRRQITLTVAEADALRRTASRARAGGMLSMTDVLTVCGALEARDDKPARRGA